MNSSVLSIHLTSKEQKHEIQQKRGNDFIGNLLDSGRSPNLGRVFFGFGPHRWPLRPHRRDSDIDRPLNYDVVSSSLLDRRLFVYLE